MIDRERMEKALDFLIGSDEEAARLKTDVKRKEYVLKRSEAHAFLSIEQGSVKDREAEARLDPGVIKAYDAHTDALEQYELIASKRQTEALIIDVFRTLEASRRQGG